MESVVAHDHALQAQRPSCKKATAALTVSLVEAVIGWIWLWMLLTPVTVLLSVLALREIAQNPVLKGKRKAKVAIGISIVVAVVSAPIMVYFLTHSVCICGPAIGG